MAKCNHKSKQIIRAFKKINIQSRSTVQQKRAKNKQTNKQTKKTVLFTTQYNPLGPNINSVFKKHLPVIIDNPRFVEMFC